MSTTIKRVALVAVAALGLGVLSVAPSQAVSQADTLTLSAATASQLTGETLTAGSASVTLAYLGGATTDSMTVSAFLVSAPAGNTVLPVLALVETSAAVVTGNGAGTTRAVGFEITSQVAGVAPSANTSAVSAKFNVYLNAPTVAGTYVVRLAPAVTAGGGVAVATAQTLTITVAKNPTSDAVYASATSYISKGETNTATTAKADDVVTSSKTASNSVAAASISASFKNAAGTAVSGESFTATVTGPGVLGFGRFGTGETSFADTYTAVGRSITLKAGDHVLVFPDGTSGVSTVTITSMLGVVLATKTLTFYGDIAKVVTTVAKPVIGVRTDAAAVTAKAYDAAGTLVSAGTLYATSADTTIISNSYTSATIDATKGYATFSLTGVKAGSTTVTVGTGSSASATTNVKADAAAVRVGGTSAELANVKVTTDKSSYAPGEIATITVTPVDAAGLALADDTYTVFATGGITSSYTLGSASVAINGTTTQDGAVAGTGTVSGSATYKVYLPAVEGDVKFSWTTATFTASAANSGVAGSVTVNVSSASTSAAIDAANEAAQAASDATDAALAAADAADAATTKAQEAVDAVATLSAQVSKLITALKAQITTLTNLVIKIQKKVKA